MNTKIDKNKADKLIAKGDKLATKGKFKRALKKYKKAKNYDPERADLYDKLVDAHDKATKEWKAKDVADSVGWVMEKQEKENPAIKHLHERLSPEWTQVLEKIRVLIMCDNEDEESKIIEEITAFGEDAVYPLIYTILQIKKSSMKDSKEDSCQREKEE